MVCARVQNARHVASRALFIVRLVTPPLAVLVLVACQPEPGPSAQVSTAALGSDPELTLGPEVVLPGRDVVTAGQSAPSLAWDGAHYLMAWRDGLGDIVAVWVDPDGTHGDCFLVGHSLPHAEGPLISWDPTHEQHVVFWIQPHADDALGDIAARAVLVTDKISDPGKLARAPAALQPARALAIPLAAAWDGSKHFVMWHDDSPAVSGGWFADAAWQAPLQLSELNPLATPGLTYAPDLVWNGAQYLLFWTDYGDRKVQTMTKAGTLGPIGVLDPYLLGGTDAAWNGLDGYVVASTSEILQLDATGATTSTSTALWPKGGSSSSLLSVVVAPVGADFLAASNSTNDYGGPRTTWIQQRSASGQITDLGSVDHASASALLWDGRRAVVALEHDPNDFYSEHSVALEPLGSSQLSFASLAADRDSIDLAVNGDHYLMTWRGVSGSPSGQGLLARVEDSAVVRSDIRFGDRLSISPRPASNGDGYLVAWRGVWGDEDGGYTSSPRSALLDASGDLTPRDGEPSDVDAGASRADGAMYDLAQYSMAQHAPTPAMVAVASDGTDYLVAFRDREGLAARIQGADGTLGPPLILTAGAGAVEAAWDGENYLLVWEDFAGADLDIQGARVTRRGKLLEGLGLSTGLGDQRHPKIAVGDGVSLIVWNDVRGAIGATVDGALVTRDGVVHPSMRIASPAIAEFAPAAAWDGREFVVAWTGGTDTIDWNVRARRLAPGPGAVLGDEFPIADSNDREYGPTLASVERKGALIAYHRARTTGREIGVRRLLLDPPLAPADAGALQDAGPAAPDATADAGRLGADAGDVDASLETPYDDDGGCLCSAPAASQTTSAPWLAPLAILTALVLRRRRRT